MAASSPAHLWAGVSASESLRLAALGIDSGTLNGMVCAITEFLLSRDFRLIFGHDWREGGVMTEVARLVQRMTSDSSDYEQLPFPRLVNCVKTELSELSDMARSAVSDSAGLFEVFSVSDWKPLGSPDLYKEFFAFPRRTDVISQGRFVWAELDNVQKNWLLRKTIGSIGQDGIRICIGGREAGFGGAYPGVAEEAYFAASQSMPLYLVAGFGGATQHIANCVSGATTVPESLLRAGRDFEPGISLSATYKDRYVRWGLPEYGLALWFEREYGMSALSRDNGLTSEQNLQLFEATDLELVFELIDIGIQKCKGLRNMSEPKNL